MLRSSRSILSSLFYPAILWLLCSLSGGCAKIGDPLPPLIHHPFTTDELQLVQVADRVDLLFAVPPGEIATVEVYRRPSTPVDVGNEVQRIAIIRREDLRKSSGSRFVFQDRPGSVRQAWYYALRFVNKQGRRSDFSRSVHTEPVAPAQPPSDLTEEVQEDQIIIRWRAPEANIDGSRPPHALGYLVNSEHFVTETEYVDRDFRFNQERTYRLQAVARRLNPLILSEFSDTLTVVPRDVFPPAAPQNVTGLLWEGRIQLLWDANKELDLRGYVVYRGRDPNQIEKSSPLITINRYTDEAISSSDSWYYQVSAVDQLGNESEKSDRVSVKSKR